MQDINSGLVVNSHEDVIREMMRQVAEPRNDEDINLVLRFRDLMLTNGVSSENILTFDINPAIMTIRDSKPEVQRLHLNIYINRQIILTGKDAYDERFCLVPDGSHEYWLAVMESRIMPFFLNNNLPCTL